MNNPERRSDRPGKINVVGGISPRIGSNTFGTAADPFPNVRTHFGPEEAQTQAVECFIFTHVSTCWAAMVVVEHGFTKGLGYNN